MMNSKILRTILILTLFLSVSNVSHLKAIASQKQTGSADMESFFDEFFAIAMTEHKVPGAAIVVVKDGEILFANGYGYSNLENSIPVNPAKTIFRWASVSKLFPIAGVLRLVEQGKMNLKADVNQYLPFWQIPNDFSKPIRIRDLLQHTDGFGSRDLGSFSLHVDDLQPLGTVLSHEIKSPVQEPGGMIAYGSYGTALAGHLLEQVTGNRFEDYIAVSFFEPLDMHQSTFYQDLPPEYQKNLAVVYNYEQDTNIFIPAPYLFLTTSPTGGLSATPLDIAHFVIALLDSGRFNKTQILSPTLAQAMLEQQFTPSPGFPGVTYGFMEHFYNNQRGLIRDGSGVGIRSQVFLLPEHKLGYIYVQNSRGDEVIEKLNEVFLDRYYPAPDATPNVEVSQENSLFAGIYRPVQTNEHTFVKLESLLIGELRVDANPDNSLTITPLGQGDVYGGFEAPSQWTEITPRVFQRADRERYLMFHQDELGRITYLFSGSGYHGSYYKLSWYEASTIQFIWLGLCLFVFLTAIVTWLYGLPNHRKEVTQTANIARWMGSVTSLFFLIGFFGVLYALFLKRIAGYPAFAFGVSPMASGTLGLLLCGTIVGLTTPVFAILAWKNGYWSTRGRVCYTVLGIATLGFVWWLNYWNLLGFRY